MAIDPYAAWMLAQEARSLLTRLRRVKPFALLQAMVPAAALQPGAHSAIEHYLAQCRRQLHGQVDQFLAWLESDAARRADAAEGQRRFTYLRLRFNAVLTQFDLFNEAIVQRSEHENGVWLAGLDVLCNETLRLPGNFYHNPPVVCYLDRGPGAAIRRAYTRLPGGGANPVALVRIPRERMIGSGIASSLVHEIGHQAAALLDLSQSLKAALGQQLANCGDGQQSPWFWWRIWISEIVADFWAVARVGVASTLGLIAVLSLPKPMVMRLNGHDPHPIPWLRVKLSCAIGDALFSHPQWQRLAKLWQSYYPLDTLPKPQLELMHMLEASMPAFVQMLIQHRPKALRGHTVIELLAVPERHPRRLQSLYRQWQGHSAQMYQAAPSLVFAVLGQARLDGAISPETESDILGKLLTHWALQGSLQTSSTCAVSVAQSYRQAQRDLSPRLSGLPGLVQLPRQPQAPPPLPPIALPHPGPQFRRRYPWRGDARRWYPWFRQQQ